MEWATINQVLLAALLAATIGLVVRIIFLAGDIKRTLGNVQTMIETARQDVDATLGRLNAVAESTDKILQEEIAPTLRVVRQTLVNVEVTTRAVADTTNAARQIVHRADALVDSRKLAAVSGTVGQFALKAAASAASNLLSGVGSGVRALFSRRREKSTEIVKAAASEARAERDAKNGLAPVPGTTAASAANRKKKV